MKYSLHSESADFEYRDELCDDEEVLCELGIYPPMTNTVEDSPPVGIGEMLVYTVSAKTGTRRKAVQRDDDLLTSQQLQENWKEVQAARLKELKA